MKIATFATISLLLAAPVPALAADPISLIGIWKGEEVGVGVLDGWDPVSYTHLTLPTNREV